MSRHLTVPGRARESAANSSGRGGNAERVERGGGRGGAGGWRVAKAAGRPAVSSWGPSSCSAAAAERSAALAPRGLPHARARARMEAAVAPLFGITYYSLGVGSPQRWRQQCAQQRLCSTAALLNSGSLTRLGSARRLGCHAREENEKNMDAAPANSRCRCACAAFAACSCCCLCARGGALSLSSSCRQRAPLNQTG